MNQSIKRGRGVGIFEKPILIKRVFNSIMFRTHTSYGRINLICQMPRKNNDKNYCIK